MESNYTFNGFSGIVSTLDLSDLGKEIQALSYKIIVKPYSLTGTILFRTDNSNIQQMLSDIYDCGIRRNLTLCVANEHGQRKQAILEDIVIDPSNCTFTAKRFIPWHDAPHHKHIGV